MTTKVVLVDDHPLIRKGIRSAFDAVADIEVVGEAATAETAAAIVDSVKPDVVFLDIELPDLDGISLLDRIKLASPATRVIMLSVFAEARYVEAALGRGAAGFLTKSVHPQQLIDSVRDVVQGNTPLCSEAATQLVSIMRGRRDGASGGLTAREQEIWELVSHGLTNGDVAGRLFISEHTVKFHVHNILRKLGAKRRAEAIYARARDSRH